MSELENFVRTNFGVIDPQEVEAISSLFTYSEVKRGDVLLESGKRCKEMIFVQAGFLRMFSLANDQEVTQWISTKGSFAFDLSGFFFESPSRWTIEALTNAQVYIMSKRAYDGIVDAVPQWKEIEKLFLIGCFTTMENRIHNHLSLSSKERYIAFQQNNPEMFKHVPVKYIASMLGMTPETLSRIRAQLNTPIS